MASRLRTHYNPRASTTSARIGAGYCNVCHYEGRGTNGFADSATFVHRIHAGKDLTNVTTGTATTGYQAANPYIGVGPHTVTSAAAPVHLHGSPALLGSTRSTASW